MSEALDAASRQIDARLAELRDDLQRLEAAAAILIERNAHRKTRQRRRGHAGGVRPGRSGTRRSSRASEAENLVRRHPGISTSDLAKRMSIQPGYLYRIMPQLQKEGALEKRGKGWHPAP